MATNNPQGVLGKVTMNIRIVNELPKEVQDKLNATKISEPIPAELTDQVNQIMDSSAPLSEKQRSITELVEQSKNSE